MPKFTIDGITTSFVRISGVLYMRIPPVVADKIPENKIAFKSDIIVEINPDDSVSIFLK